MYIESLLQEKEWCTLYKAGAFVVFAAMAVMVAEIFITALPDGAPVQMTGQGLLELYIRRPFMGMRYMGLMNIFATTLMLPVFLCFFGVHRTSTGVLAAFALLVSLVGYGVFLSGNVALPVLHLSRQYAPDMPEQGRLALVSATEALIAKGASHTPGTFPGFFLGEMGNILFCVVMLNGKRFRKRTAITGLIAFSFLALFEVASSFIPSLDGKAIILAVIGGISAITWYLFTGIELLGFSKEGVGDRAPVSS
jgi:hypothetical protein